MSEASYLKSHPLGTPIPHSPHAVCVSLPTMQDVIAYEEKNPDTMEAIKQGYPRFRQHFYIEELAARLAAHTDIEDALIVPCASAQAANDLVKYAGVGCVRTLNTIDCALLPKSPDAALKAKKYQQHTGTALSSREAMATLSKMGVALEKIDEVCFEGDALEHVTDQISKYCPSAEGVQLTRSGMNAFYAAFRAAADYQAQHGRTVWLQLGWLYLDTQCILKEFLPDGGEYIVRYDIFDLSVIESIFEQYAGRIAGVVTEAPTNPLVQTPDLERLSELTIKHGAIRIFDPSLVSIANVDITPLCDVVVTSLTKYSASYGDVMAGAVWFNSETEWRARIGLAMDMWLEPPYRGDLARLAHQVCSWGETIHRINSNTMAIAPWLEQHPGVKKVHWAYSKSVYENYSKVAGSDKPGGIITIELNKPLKEFYDSSIIVKGPSFGTAFTMMCPFMYLAHYDMVTSKEGRAELEANGLAPELIRLSIGSEPFGCIQEALNATL